MKVVDADKLVEIIRERDFPKKGELHRIILQLAFDAPIGEIPTVTDKSQIDYTNVYYPEPMQVMYVDSARAIKFGIVFHEYLIDLSTGRACTCQEVLRTAQKNGIDLDDAIIERSEWYKIGTNPVS